MAALSPTTKVHYSFRDRSNELTRTQLHLNAIDDTVGTPGVLDPATGDIFDVGVALADLTKLNPAGTTFSIETSGGIAGLPIAADAQREWGVRWSYQDNVTGAFYRFDTPAPTDAMVQAGTDQVDMTATEVVAFKTIFESACNSPVGNNVTLLGGKITNRRG